MPLKHFKYILVVLAISACSSMGESPENKLVVSSVRDSLIWGHKLFVVASDGSGNLSRNLPKQLGDEPEWSPKGDYIVFSTVYSEGARAGGDSNIYLLRSDGRQIIPLVETPWKDKNPTWSTDGRKIAFSKGANTGEIFILNAQCYLEEKECHESPEYLTKGDHPDWSPTDERIVYANQGQIMTISTSGDAAPVVISPGYLKNCTYPDWSPTGESIVFSCEGHIYTVAADGTNLKRLTDNEGGGMPLWSPDGQHISFISGRDGLGQRFSLHELFTDALFLMDANGSNIIRLTHRNDEYLLWYAWLPEN